MLNAVVGVKFSRQLHDSGGAVALGLERLLLGRLRAGDVFDHRRQDLFGVITQFDFRVAKVLRYGRTRTNLGLDLFNLFNASPVATYNQSFVQTGASWLQPTSIIGARIVKLSVQLDF